MAGTLVIKQIKPRRFNDKAFRASLLGQMTKTKNDMLKDFQKTTATWKHKVEFEAALSQSLGGASVHVITTDEIYNYVNNGTDPHPIFAGQYTGLSNKKALSFKWGGKGSYRPKTRPRIIGSTPGGPTGPRVARAYVQHPGTKPRKFDLTIGKKWEPMFKRRMEQAMSKAAQASGHGIP